MNFAFIGWRSKALCCTPNQDALNVALCDADLCEEGSCDAAEIDDEYIEKRFMSDGADHLEERAKSNRPAGAAVQRLLELEKGLTLIMTSAPYPSGAKVFSGGGVSTLALKGGFMMADTVCTNLGVAFHSVGNIPTSLTAISGKTILWATEHWREVSQEISHGLYLLSLRDIRADDHHRSQVSNFCSRWP